ncbi:2,3-dihydroxybiphenyl 1,2-dioxygenase [Mycolicibacterium sp. BK556]|uniref:biphenyl-2,3-diol 1,2-dioxygenase n=1 Tax=Mycobacteriaceae TaxID=1762 RepID=UPI001061A7D0|nr:MULTISPECIES: biphenyl-2,3-diol 1,2-dioxygenase [Mycobacteriaceae]MBB3600383.1 2,3-dihydroxybiphenyl 1,2-dioxygenase [Mycolicibacterium sp. BK556]MBB3630135.1 2,3-dihydroxybiphenyl 1,2-dioxygenase [Mycolicibacterium sp. BK607]MBB3748133.1 2,3-dihydroxybiphenyl 1,2-dioxygenase [Mycolicibacterium sp. BK634]TDO09950.1 2,3-dihydroxybiphenyl 1,2-dioxygenase [Mycobacterium sp. BK086]
MSSQPPLLNALGYIRIQTADIERWRSFAHDVLGFAPGTGPDPDALYLRMDEHHARIVVTPADSDGLLAVGWQVADGGALDEVVVALEKNGTEVQRHSQDEADQRRVEELVSCTDPAGTVLEIFHGPLLDHSPVVTPFGSRFVTASQGLGHVVLPVSDLDGVFDFYTQVLGFLPRGAFRLPLPLGVPPQRVRFLGINRRHHSLALCPAPSVGPPGLVHIMVEVDTLDAVGRALDRVAQHGFPVSSTLGRHTNDKMVSFYVRAPGGWDIEFGTEGWQVDTNFYCAEEISADSYWGHDWSGSEPLAALKAESALKDVTR